MCKRLHSHDYVDLLLTTLAEFPGLVVTYFIVDKYGRRLSLAAVLGGMSIGYSILFICPGRTVTDAAFFIARALAISSFNTIVLYGAEIYPTNMRATGTCKRYVTRTNSIWPNIRFSSFPKRHSIFV